MENTKEISKNLETINTVISIIGAIALCTSIAVHIIGWDRHSVLATIARVTLWLTLTYISVFDPLI